jgi:isopenicillin-N N-acyltransferase-like protein
MGYQHGEQAAELIERYLRWIEKSNQRERDDLGQRARAFLPFIEKLNPALIQEVRGLSAGAQIPFEHALLCQTRGEAAQAPIAEDCTAFAFRGKATTQGQTLAGQNQDLPPEFSDLGIVLHIKPTDHRPRAITFTFAGQLGYMGMNARGVAHFANGLSDYTWQLGLPHYPLKCTLLEKNNMAECLDILNQHRTSSAANMVVCDGDGEIANIDTDSVARLQRIRGLVRGNWGKIDVECIKNILGDHEGDPGAICRHGAGGTHSICGYIAEPARGLFHLRRGHGCLGTWTAYEV